jgi:hypothetical protein
MKKIFLFVVLLFSVVNYSQELKKPSEGKALVYFVRSSALGFLINFKYFDGDKFLGKFNHGSYLVYECDPGKHVFWARSENTDFIEAELESGKVYIVDSEPRMGAIKSAVKLVPFDTNSEHYKTPKKYEKKKKSILESILKNKEYIISNEDLEEFKKDYESIIKKSTEKYNKLKGKGEEFVQVLPEMYYNN